MLPDPAPPASDPAPSASNPAITASDAPVPVELLPDNASLDPSGRVSVGGVDLLELCSEVGTPVFVYDEEHLRDRCAQAVSAWGSGVAYASKAFLCRAMARLAHEEGMRIDVSTGGEMHVVLAAGVPASRLVFHGNNKSEEELASALRYGVGRIVVDSFDEIERLERLAQPGGSVRVLIRVNPGIEAHTHEYVMTGQEDSKFGFSLASGAAHEAAKRLTDPSSPLDLVGIHAHIGSQIFALESFTRAVNVLADFLAQHCLSELCVGGGLGVGYVTGEPTPSIAQWAQLVKSAARSCGIDSSVELSAEPGRSIVARAALTCYTVGTVKVLGGIRTYVSVDGGMSDNPRPVLYGSGYEAFLPRDATASRGLVATIVGKHCESGDIVVRDAHLPEDVSVGDILATPVTGAYGHSMASNYNKVPRPPVVFVAHGSYKVVVRRETYADLLALDA